MTSMTHHLVPNFITPSHDGEHLMSAVGVSTLRYPSRLAGLEAGS
jgi:hypothetical protein